MKTIIVPTDFSDNATHALRYACMLNSAFNGKIILFHSYAVPVFAPDASYVILPDDDELKKESHDLLNKQKKKISAEFPGMTFETLIDEGFAEQAITETSKKKKADLLVMGIQGASGLREALIGSITAAVMEDTACPVIAVPEKAKVDKLEKIVFATDYSLNDFENIGNILELAKPFNAEVILLHVSSGDLDKAYEFAAIENFKEKIAAKNKYDRISFKLLESRDVLDGLNFYLDEIRADLLAMSMHHRTFFQKMFNRSKTKRMAFHTHIPLLAFHAEK
jgi:nucleotide-binding universal stress UspA family protein